MHLVTLKSFRVQFPCVSFVEGVNLQVIVANRTGIILSFVLLFQKTQHLETLNNNG